MIKVYLSCLNCGHHWVSRKRGKVSKLCPHCHNSKFETISQFTHLREKLMGTTPKLFPYRRNWGKNEKSVPQKGESRGY